MKRKALISSRHRITTRYLSEYFLLRISHLQLRLFIFLPLVGWLEQGGWPWVDHSRSLYRSTATLLGHARASMSDTNEIFLLHSLLLADFTTIVVSICSTEQSLTRTQDYPINKLGQGVKKVCGAWRSSSKSPRPTSSIQSSRLQVSLNLINSLLESDIVLLLLRTFSPFAILFGHSAELIQQHLVGLALFLYVSNVSECYLFYFSCSSSGGSALL